MKNTLTAILATSLLTIGANAATLFTVIDGPAGNRTRANTTVGQEFTVGGSDLLVTSLGYEDSAGDGLVDSHQVGIWDAGGLLVGTVTVPAGTGTTLIDAWRFQALTVPVTLTAGGTYRIGGGNSTTGDAFTDADFAGGGAAADFAISGDASSPAAPNRFGNGAFVDPTTDGGGATSLRWAAGNLEYTVVPEPGSSLLIGLAGLALVLRRRRLG